MKNLQVKFVLVVLSIMSISGILSLVISTTLFKDKVLEKFKLNQSNLVSNIIYLYEESELSLEKILDLNTNNRYDVTLINPTKEDNYNLSLLKNKEIHHMEEGYLPLLSTIFKLDNHYIKISNSLDKKNLFYKFMLLNSIALIISILVALAISTLFSKRLLSPIRNLNTATKKISQGIFNIKVTPPKDHELGILTENFNKMAKELSSIETLRNDFVSNVSHEIKTPLGSIQGFAKLIQNENISKDERMEFTSIIISESARLSKLTSNVLKLSKLENQDVIGETSMVSLDEQMRKVILILEKDWSIKNLNLHIDLDKVNIYSNEDLLEHIWINIIGNSIKFTKPSGNITINLSDLDNKVVVKISDDGIGMTEKTKKHIFEKFYQGDTSHKEVGNGLGLPLVKRIIELCNGKIKVRSSLNHGTSFTIELPKCI